MTAVIFSLGIVLLVSICHFSDASSGYTYDDPSVWASTYPICGGDQQSPIDLQSSLSAETTHENFQINNHQQTITENMTNTGHSLVITVGHSVTINGGGLHGTYNIDQFHFHWGGNSSVGSEHTIDNGHYPLELHVVAHNSSYSSFDDAKNHTDGLAVFGFLYQIRDENNTHLNGFLDHISDVLNLDNHIEITYRLSDVMESSKMTTYFRYHGSLTTPDCHQSVTWTVFDQILGISETQMGLFRMVYSDNGTHHLTDNFRPVQSLHGRTVNKYSYSASSGAAELPAQRVLVLAGGVLALLLIVSLVH